MSCIDLETEARSTVFDEASKLCLVCMQLYLYFVDPTTTPCQANNDHYDVYNHFHIGPLYHVLAKTQFCAGCRLISMTVLGSVNAVDDTGRLKIQRKDVVSATSTIIDRSIHRSSDFLESMLEVILELDQEPPFTSERVIGTIIRSIGPELDEVLWLSGRDKANCPGDGLIGDFHRRGRMVPDILDRGLVKDWIHHCDTQHKECLLRLERRKGLITSSKIRLIDVKERRIISTTQQEQEYVALSYVWGENTMGSLNTNTVKRFSSRHGIPNEPNIIPQTILDTIMLVSDIGLRYLWVDSLCILQDNDKDKLEQLNHMDSIYSCANLVIIAATGSDAHAGLPGVVRSRGYRQHTENIGGFSFITAQPPIREALEWTQWNSRGWTFQEAVLANRALVFTEHQVYWNCQANCWREDMACEIAIASTETDNKNSLWAKTIDRGLCPAQVYCDHVKRFSRRDFKDTGDVLWAFKGVLRSEVSRFPKGFIWGLPYEILDVALLWSVDCPCLRIHRRQSPHHVREKEGASYKLRFPSWSWLSADVSVVFLHSCEEDIISKVSWLEPYLIERDTAPPAYLESIRMSCNNSSKTSPDQQNTPLFASDTDDNFTMHYGFLRFTAQTAQLDIKRDTPNDGQAEISDDRDYRVAVGVHGTFGTKIGTMRTASSFFRSENTRTGECVLLSANARDVSDEVCKRHYGVINGAQNEGKVSHVDGCDHVESYNIMLIEWDGDIARRVGLGIVEQEAWESLEICQKLIVLG